MTGRFFVQGRVRAWLLALIFPSFVSAQDVQAIASAIRSGDFSTASDLAMQDLKKTPDDPKLWTLQGVALASLHNESAAIASFQQAQKLSPHYLPAIEGEAQLEFKIRNPAAGSTIGHILAIDPHNAVAHGMLGALSYDKKDCTGTTEHYRQSLSVIRTQPSALQQFGSCLLRLEQFKEALPVFQTLVESDPSNDTAKFNLAAAQVGAQLPQQALTTIATLGNQHVPIGRVAEISSSAYELLGNTPRAVETLRSAILLNPTDEDLYISFATLCMDHRSYDVAIKFLDAGLQALPGSSRLLVTRGIVYVQMANYTKAESDFVAAEQLDPLHRFGSAAQGLSQLQQSNLDLALATTEQEIKRSPDDAFLYYLKAETLRQQGVDPGTPAFIDAVNAAAQAVRLKPHYPLAQDLLGTLYIKADKNDLAAQAFRAALADDPNDQSALYHLLTLARKEGKSNDIPDLLKRLAQAKRKAQSRDVELSRYRILEASGGTTMQGVR